MFLLPFKETSKEFVLEEKEKDPAQDIVFNEWVDEQKEWWDHLRKLKHEVENEKIGT